MKLPPFKTEQWMNIYENDAVYNLTDTCVSALTFRQLTAMDPGDRLHDLKLDYGVIPGNEALRKCILSLYQTGTIDDITLADGCLHANELIMNTLLESGDQVLTFSPGYQQFTDVPRSLGCEVTEIKLHEETGWQPELEDISAAFASHRFRLVILNMPNNPTGSMLNETILQALLQYAERCGSYILCDEVYRDPQFPSIADLYPLGISTSSLSKLFSLAGLRLGWIKGPRKLIEKINERRDYSMISTGPLRDTLALIALENKDQLLCRSRSRIKEDQAVIEQWLKTDPRMSIQMPVSGTVGFLKYDAPINSEDLARDLLRDTGVFFVPGSCFDCDYHLRLTFTAEPETLRRGLQLLSGYLTAMGHPCQT
ncbi:aminotransferase class I/II-fold pyridoxal phosphate-dependent enzyme [Galactobacillus timonensis]|uniref:aminotransferase class I/II-fold pyridoxal phosphate-dependent enzyme n=2 Tax=Galactobacillus timonensis TaxID=2041840 RepID=UPI002409B070|nr:aminotransferase class I/II-fold pyridoxal phosphate-dependent enzyme [Galactobacillus timonensis]